MTAEEILQAAVELPTPAERRAFLEGACGGDRALRAEVEGLVKAHEAAGSFLEQPLFEPPETSVLPPAEQPGVQVGPYKLLQQIGEGGMGVVYMAEQSQPVHRRVALKIIKPGMDSRSVLARFEAERQALALMDHPNIAKVFDAGATEAGRPYFAMELVKGVPITKYCDEHHLTPRQRLELFAQVCQAVQHAHQKGLIHRDLKPSNVLVAEYDAQPVPKVIDFGVAKATGPKLTDRTLFTELGTVVGTLEYMSPEQAKLNALDIDTRSDVYALGVLLYELLTGTTPFDRGRLREAAFDEGLRIIREEEPPRPSTRLSTTYELASIAASRGTEPARLSKLVRGELDWIVMKALEKDRNRRYETANGLAMDVQRYLADEAVAACPPSTWHRLKKFVRRNKSPVAVGVTVAAALIAGVVGTTIGMMRAEERAEGERRAKLAAQEREEETRAVLNFVEQKVFAIGRPAGQEGSLLGRDVSLRQAMEAALPFVEQNFKSQPLIEARLRMMFGYSFWCLGEVQIGANQFQTAREILTRHHGPDHPDTLTAMNDLANCYGDLRRFPEALKLYEEVLARRKVVLGPAHPKTLQSMVILGNIYTTANRFDEAATIAADALARQKATLGPDHLDTLFSMMILTRINLAAGRLTEALKLGQETTAAMQKARLPLLTPLRLWTMRDLGDCYFRLGRHAEALKLREEMAPLMRQYCGPEHPLTLLAMRALAESYERAGRRTEAFKLHDAVLAAIRTRRGPILPDLVFAMADIAKSLITRDRGSEAIPVIDSCIANAPDKAVSPRFVPRMILLRVRHFQKKKDAAGVRATAEMQERLNPLDADDLYNAACYRAVLASILRARGGADAAKDAAAETDRAMEWLRKAVAAGFTNTAQMKQDADLDVLRERDDFKKLIADQEANRK